MRGPSALEPGVRELIAAYVSALNGCAYCRGVHEVVAAQFGIAHGTLDALLADVEAAPVDARLKPLLRYVHALTLEPGRVREQEARAVLDAGWGDDALHDGVSEDGRRIPAAGAFDRRMDERKLDFSHRDGAWIDSATGSRWNVFGEAVEGPLKGRRLRSVGKGVHFAFAWLAFRPDSDIVRSPPG